MKHHRFPRTLIGGPKLRVGLDGQSEGHARVQERHAAAHLGLRGRT